MADFLAKDGAEKTVEPSSEKPLARSHSRFIHVSTYF